MTCHACTAHTRALSSIDEALAAAALELGGPAECTCLRDVETPPHAGVVRSLGALLAGAAEIDRYGDCTHVVRAMPHETRGLCRTCWRDVPLFPALPVAELIAREEERADEADRLAAEGKGAAAQFMREVARRARWSAMRLREIAARAELELAAE